MYKNGAFFSEPVIYSKPNANRFLTSFLLWLIYATVFLPWPRKSRINHKSRMLGRYLCTLNAEKSLKPNYLSFGSTTWCHFDILPPEKPLLSVACLDRANVVYLARLSSSRAVTVLIILGNSPPMPQVQLKVDWIEEYTEAVSMIFSSSAQALVW